MDTKDLKCFEVVYEEKSISKAAKKLFISPQGLGKIIRRLEAEFDTVFFERTGQGLIPLESAHLFHRHVKEIVERVHLLTEEMQVVKKQNKRLRVGFSNGVLRSLSLNLIFRFMEQNPDITVEWSEYENSELIERLQHLEIDYGFCVGKATGVGVAQKLIKRIGIVALVYEGHPFYQEELLTIDMLRGEKLLSMNEQFHIYHELLMACKAKGFMPDIRVKTADGSTLQALCEQKLGIAITPEFTRKWEGAVRAIPFEGQPSWDIYRIWKADRRIAEPIQRFEDFLNER